MTFDAAGTVLGKRSGHERREGKNNEKASGHMDSSLRAAVIGAEVARGTVMVG